MKNIFIPLLSVFLLLGIFLSITYILPEETSTPGVVMPAERNLPEFESFSVASLYKGETKKPNFASEPNARPFRSAITKEAEEKGVNFAGHYTLVNWGCGTSCQSYAIIDAVTGAIVEYGFSGNFGARFMPWSRLLIINPTEYLPVGSGSLGADVIYYALNQKNDLSFLGKKFFRTGEVMCSRALKAKALEIATGKNSEMNLCLLPKEGFVVVDMIPDPAVNFADEGNISDIGEGKLTLVYEEPGSPALFLNLAFNGASECFRSLEGKIPCEEASFKEGDRVYAEGFKSGDDLTVWVLEVKNP